MVKADLATTDRWHYGMTAGRVSRAVEAAVSAAIQDNTGACHDRKRCLPFGMPVLVWRGEKNRGDYQAL